MDNARHSLRWRLGIIAALAVTLLALYPQFNLQLTRGAQWNDLPIYAAALVAQFVVDSAAMYVLARSAVRISLRSHVRSMLSAYAFDTVLAPLGLLAAFPASQHPDATMPQRMFPAR